MERRLSAILASDVVGYSKLMAEDEVGTLNALREHRQNLFDPEIAKRGGRIVKLMGDGTLVEFPSVVNAVEAAVVIQKALATDDGPIKLRIGINLGDVIIDGEDIYGDGVNVAARLETLAETGGICISSIVHESLGNRIDADFADAGEHEVKNIARPIRVFRWPAQGGAAAPIQPVIPAELKRENTISVSHFENLSDEAELGYFCEGVAEDIAAALGNIAQLTVVSDEHLIDDSKAAPSDRVAAHYVLAGKVRKAGSRIRVSAHLVDRHTGIQRWADRFEHDATDLFEVQDDVTRNIVIGVHTELGAGAYTNQWQWGTENLEAWQLLAKGFSEFQKFSPDSMAKTASMMEQALAKDPDYLAPLMVQAYCYSYLALISDSETAQKYIAKAQANIERSLAETPNDVRSYSAKRGIEIALGNFDDAVVAAETALEMEPNNAACRGTYAMALMSADRPGDALAQLTKATQDMTIAAGWMVMSQIQSNYMLDNLTEALRISREIVGREPDFYPGPVLCAALAAELELADEAAAMRKRVLDIDPHFSAELFVRSQGLKNVTHRKRLFEALIGAGLPK
ncbi:MAG: hypothetical protein O7I42_10005 [Alphaproteobacteria bacterium]|nr:hypothetical protein [Alphaproteobacteria bacterium]